MEWIVFWILCGVVSAIVASKKGKDGVTWFIIGALLGPFGIIISLVTKRDEEGLVNQGGQKKCPYCAELIKAEAIICKHCGKEQGLLENTDTSHVELQKAIANGNEYLVKTILENGLNIADSSLKIPHLDYAKMYKNQTIIDLIEQHSKAK